MDDVTKEVPDADAVQGGKKALEKDRSSVSFATLLKKEILSNILTARFAVTFALFFGGILLSIYILTNDYRINKEKYNSNEAANRDAINEIDAIEDPGEKVRELLGSRGIYSPRPPRVLSFLSKGLEESMPSQVHVSRGHTRKVNEELFKNPLFLLVATPDFSYIVNIVLSLLALIFVFDTICGEKERGTLRLVLSNSVARDALILAKWAGAYLTLIVPFIIAISAGLAYVYISAVVPLGTEELFRIALLLFVSMLYILLFCGLGIFISTVTHRSATALLVSLFVWVIWILVIPNLSPVIARIASPVPTLQKIEGEKAAIDQEMTVRKREIGENLVGFKHLGRHKKLLDELEEEKTRRHRELDDFFEKELGTQISIAKVLSRLSPSASFKYASSELAQTGINQYDGFKKAYRRFENDFEDYQKLIWEKMRSRKLEDDWLRPEELPRLRLIDANLNESIDFVLIDVILMFMFVIVFFTGSYLFFMRYDVT